MIKQLNKQQLAMMLNYIGMNNIINGINCLEDIYVSHVGGVDLIPADALECEENLPDHLLILCTGGGRESSWSDFVDLMTIAKVQENQCDSIAVDDETWHIFTF